MLVLGSNPNNDPGTLLIGPSRVSFMVQRCRSPLAPLNAGYVGG